MAESIGRDLIVEFFERDLIVESLGKDLIVKPFFELAKLHSEVYQERRDSLRVSLSCFVHLML